MRIPSFSLLLSAALLAACSEDTTTCVETTSPPMEGALQWVRYNEPQRWADVDYPTLRAAELAAVGGEAFEGESPRAVQWLQAWADHFDAIVRSQVERDLGAPLAAPKPTVVLVDGTPNPASVPLVPVAIQDSNADGLTGLVFSPASPPFVVVNAFPTLSRPAAWPTPPELLRFLDTQAGVGRVAEQGGRYYFPCESLSRPDQGVSILAVGSYVRVAREALRSYSEHGVLTVLAHELAHIYRAHGTAGMASPSYWYDRSADGRWEPVMGDQQALVRAYDAAESGSTNGADPALVELATINGIGLSTVESQADRLSTQILVRAGLSSDDILDGMLETMETHELRNLRYDDGPNADACRELVERGFRDAQDARVFMPIFGAAGQDREHEHPGACYRIFDAYEELARHPETPGARPTLDIDWDEASAEL